MHVSPPLTHLIFETLPGGMCGNHPDFPDGETEAQSEVATYANLHNTRWQQWDLGSTPRHPEASHLSPVLLTRRDPVGALGGGLSTPRQNPFFVSSLGRFPRV